jgi:hypothetical protein
MVGVGSSLEGYIATCIRHSRYGNSHAVCFYVAVPENILLCITALRPHCNKYVAPLPLGLRAAFIHYKVQVLCIEEGYSHCYQHHKICEDDRYQTEVVRGQ